jgi:hypothetical protein
MKPRFLQRISHSSRLNCFENSRSSRCVGGFSTSAYLRIIVDLASTKIFPLASLLFILSHASALLGREESFEVFNDFGRSDKFLPLVAVRDDFAPWIDHDEARNAASGIFF